MAGKSLSSREAADERRVTATTFPLAKPLLQAILDDVVSKLEELRSAIEGAARTIPIIDVLLQQLGHPTVDEVEEDEAPPARSKRCDPVIWESDEPANAAPVEFSTSRDG